MAFAFPLLLSALLTVQGGGKLNITSERSDFDRDEGVAMFERHAVVHYAEDTVLCADRLFVFFTGTNELNRIVAIGNVTMTNGTRTGSCAMAKFRRISGEITMYGEGEKRAELVSGDEGVSGSRIRIWRDTEQVVVDDTTVRVEKAQGGLK